MNTPAKLKGIVWNKLTRSQQDRCRRAMLRHHAEKIASRGHTLSCAEVETEYMHLQQRAHTNTLGDNIRPLALACGII